MPATRLPWLVAACLAVGFASLLAPWTPGYDAWAWLVWGREIVELDLDTSAGPAWKPLPVLVTTILAPLGAAAPAIWVGLARAAALLAVVLAFRTAARLSGDRRPLLAGTAAALGLALTAGFLSGAAVGSSEGLLIALVLLALECHLDGHRRVAFALGVAAALLRPEVWPFLAVYSVHVWRAERESRALVALLLPAVPALWFLPELWGSGELLRSAGRARIPNPGAPALAEHPAAEVTARFLAMIVPATAFGALLALASSLRERAIAALGAAALAWVAIVAGMSELGYSGEERYLLPAAALACLVGGVGLARLAALGRPALVAVLLVVGAPLPFALAGSGERVRDLAYAAELRHGLAPAIEGAGGRERLLACGRPFAGRYRFPLVAWHLETHIADFDLAPRPSGVVFRSRLRRSSRPEPAVPPAFRPLGGSKTWDVFAACERPERSGLPPLASRGTPR